MQQKPHLATQVGAPDPERRSSPILDPSEGEELSLHRDFESDACYFNDRRFAIGDYVRSGSELLHCAERGVWLKVREEHPA